MLCFVFRCEVIGIVFVGISVGLCFRDYYVRILWVNIWVSGLGRVCVNCDCIVVIWLRIVFIFLKFWNICIMF